METWIEFFRSMEGGVRISEEQQRNEWIDNLALFRKPSLDLSLVELPGLTDLESAYRRVHPAKATGADGIDALLCHKSPAMFARKTDALLFKMITHGQESLHHKGGRLHPLCISHILAHWKIHTQMPQSALR